MNRKQFGILLILAALWGASFLFMRVAVQVLGPIWLIEGRVLIAGLVLLPLIIYQGQAHLLRSHFRPLLFAGLFSAALPFTLFAYAAIELSAGLTSIIGVDQCCLISSVLNGAGFFTLFQITDRSWADADTHGDLSDSSICCPLGSIDSGGSTDTDYAAGWSVYFCRYGNG